MVPVSDFLCRYRPKYGTLQKVHNFRSLTGENFKLLEKTQVSNGDKNFIIILTANIYSAFIAYQNAKDFTS